MVFRTGVVGAAGFAGVELVRRLIEHPSFQLCIITSDADAGMALSSVYPAFAGATDIAFSRHDDPALFDLDVVFLAVPHTASLAVTPQLIDAGVTVIDLSADYRLKDAAAYEQWYGVPHTSPSLLAQAAFGLPELASAELQQAAQRHAQGEAVLVACAGCYPTASTLAAYPAVNAGLTSGVINVHAVSGVTGAGKKPSPRTHFCHANEGAEAYGVGTHRHTPEMEQILSAPGRVMFVPHLVPMNRGILSTVSMQIDPSAAGFSLEAAHELYAEFYSQSRFVTVLPLGSQPHTSSVAGTNNAQIGLGYRAQTRSLVATCAIDNLGKGAADQAIQCANIVFGLAEDEGLSAMALPV